MNLLQQSASSWKELTEYRCLFTYGFKKKLYQINLMFLSEDYPHLAGFQYMKDISLPNYTSAKIVDRILESKISFKQIQGAAKFNNLIKPRLEALVHLKHSLDNTFTLYSYTPHMYPFITSIKADYLISSHSEMNSFVFIIQSSSHEKSKCNFVRCSTFQQGKRNYETNQSPRTLMKKERIHIPSGTSTILFDKFTLQKQKIQLP